MVRILKQELIGGQKYYIEASGLSTDTKPIDNLLTGSVFIEVDTGAVGMFDETANTWHMHG